MRTLDEIKGTPALLLTEEEIDMLDPEDREWARNFRQRHARYEACPKHESVGFSRVTGWWHSYHCKHCGKDMSWDSSD
jgi:hypothetical protein